MDELDRRLFKALERNPRLTFRELSKMLGTSIPTVWERMTSLERSSCIQSYHAWVSLEALGGIRAIVYGKSGGCLDVETLKAIEDNGCIIVAMSGGQNYLYLKAELLTIAELDGILKVAEGACGIPEPEVLIREPRSFSAPSSSGRDRLTIEDLKDTDWRILYSLRREARKPVTRIASEFGLSRKTVRKHLARMIDSNLIEFYLNADPQNGDELHFIVLVKLRSMMSRDLVMSSFVRYASPSIFNCMSFSDHPNLLGFELFARSVAEFDDKVSMLLSQDGVVSVTWNLCQRRYYFNNWRDRMLEDKVREIRLKEVPVKAV